MNFVLVFNLLIGQMPDAVGLLVFGIAMIGTSVMLRRLVNEKDTGETNESAIKESL